MRNTLRLFFVLTTVVSFLMAWITGRLQDRAIVLLILLMTGATLLIFILLNLMDHRDAKRRRVKRESQDPVRPSESPGRTLRSNESISLRERKSGLTWGGGNIKASEATRGTRRKFLQRK